MNVDPDIQVLAVAPLLTGKYKSASVSKKNLSFNQVLGLETTGNKSIQEFNATYLRVENYSTRSQVFIFIPLTSLEMTWLTTKLISSSDLVKSGRELLTLKSLVLVLGW